MSEMRCHTFALTAAFPALLKDSWRYIKIQ